MVVKGAGLWVRAGGYVISENVARLGVDRVVSSKSAARAVGRAFLAGVKPRAAAVEKDLPLLLSVAYMVVVGGQDDLVPSFRRCIRVGIHLVQVE
jgi:hypothetical protein